MKGKGAGAGQGIEYFFALLLVVLALVLLAFAKDQTKWIDGLRFAAQPRLLPVIALFGMGLFLVPLAIKAFKITLHYQEIIIWLRPAEYLFYFLLYVNAVQRLGYGPSTIIFCPLLAWRAGCSVRQRIAAALVGLFVVLFFKGALSVKIPGVEWYENLSEPMRTFLILYF